jgi:hypothetical protein
MGRTTVRIILHGSKQPVLGALTRRPILVYQAANSEEELRRIPLLVTWVNGVRLWAGGFVINSKSWTGTAVWCEEGEPFPIRKAAGPALLVLNDEGGLLRAGPTFPETLRVDLRFGWEEVEKIERMRYLGIPFLNEAVRFTLKPTATGPGSRTFSFGGIMTKRTTQEIVDFGESEGVRVEREAKFKIVRP